MRTTSWLNLVFALLLCACSFATLSRAGAPGKVSEYSHGVTVVREGKVQPLTARMSLKKGDIIETAADTSAEIQFANATAVLMPGTKIKILNPSIFEWFGEVWMNGLFETRTQYVVAASKGTKYVVRQRKGQAESEVIVLEGAVRCGRPPGEGSGEFVTVTQNQKAIATDKATGDRYKVASLSPDELNEIRGRLGSTGLVAPAELGTGSVGTQSRAPVPETSVPTVAPIAEQPPAIPAGPIEVDVGPDGETLALGVAGPAVEFPPNSGRTTPTYAVIGLVRPPRTFAFAENPTLRAMDLVLSMPAEGTPLGSQFVAVVDPRDLEGTEPQRARFWSQAFPEAIGCPASNLKLAVGLGDDDWLNLSDPWFYFAASIEGARAVATLPSSWVRARKATAKRDTISVQAQFVCGQQPNVRMPNLRGLTLAQADVALSAVGLKRGTLIFAGSERQDPRLGGTVSDQEVPPDGPVVAGLPISLVLLPTHTRPCAGRVGYFCSNRDPSAAMKCEGGAEANGQLSCDDPNGFVICDAKGAATVRKGHVVCQ